MLKRTTSSCDASLSRIIEDEILPRLLGAHPLVESSDALKVHASVHAFSPTDIVAFANACIGESPAAAQAIIDRSLEEGVESTDLFIHLITPTARYLGELWERDLSDFANVTIGLARLHEIAHRLGYAYQGGPQTSGPLHRIMLTTAPGSQHLLGLIVVSDFFRRANWEVVIEVGTSEETILETVANEWFDLAGVSVATEHELRQLQRLLPQLRQSSCNPDLKFMLGGPIFVSAFAAEALRMATSLDTIGCCTSAPDAVALAEQHLPARPA
ncbi:MAG: cobalamin B12-binding domain-containing protein [Burkholderiaceae bacterium]